MDTMLSATAYGNWKQPIDANIIGIQSTWKGELRIPFACHIRQTSSTQPRNGSFPQFARIPGELQLCILRFCDKATLFRLMQTSRSIRTEASKLFFSDPDAWYRVDGGWLARGGHPNDGIDDVGFLQNIQRVCIDFEPVLTRGRDYGAHVVTDEDFGKFWTDEQIRKFWTRVQCLLPQARYIIVRDDIIVSGGRNAVDASTAVCSLPDAYIRMCRLCPLSIELSVSMLRRDGRLRRKLWRRTAVQKDNKEIQDLLECQDHPGPNVIVPLKRFRGPLGACQNLTWQMTARRGEKMALLAFRVAAVERYHFYERQEIFGCEHHSCVEVFNQPEEYTTHVATNNVHADDLGLPPPYRSLFADAEQREVRLQQLYSKMRKQLMGGEFGSEEREVAKKEFQSELREWGVQDDQGWKYRWRVPFERDVSRCQS